MDRWFIICPKHIYRCDLVFLYERRENASFSAKSGNDGRTNAVVYFKLPLILKKNKALLNLSMYFSKIIYHRVYLGKIWRNRKFHDASTYFDFY